MSVRKMITIDCKVWETLEKTVGKKDINGFVEDVMRDALRDQLNADPAGEQKLRGFTESEGSVWADLIMHSQKVGECVGVFKEMTDLYFEGKFKESRKLAEKVSELEHEADEIANKIRYDKSKELHPPFDGEIIVLVNEQDLIANQAEDVGDLMGMRETSVPLELKVELKKIVEKTVDSAELLKKLTSELGKKTPECNINKLSVLLSQIKQNEHDADIVELELMRKIYSLEGKIEPFASTHLLRLAESICIIPNSIADAGEQFRMIIGE